MSPMCMTAARRRPTSVHVNGASAVLLTIVKAGASSTLDIINGVKSLLPQIVADAPEQP